MHERGSTAGIRSRHALPSRVPRVARLIVSPQELVSKYGLKSEMVRLTLPSCAICPHELIEFELQLSSTGMHFGRHDPLARCASFRVRRQRFSPFFSNPFSPCFFSFARAVRAGCDATAQAALRYLWSSAQVGATKFSPTNGVDYYASLFAFELVALFMCARLHLDHPLSPLLHVDDEQAAAGGVADVFGREPNDRKQKPDRRVDRVLHTAVHHHVRFRVCLCCGSPQ
jgi:hypothetical protein